MLYAPSEYDKYSFEMTYSFECNKNGVAGANFGLCEAFGEIYVFFSKEPLFLNLNLIDQWPYYEQIYNLYGVSRVMADKIMADPYSKSILEEAFNAKFVGKFPNKSPCHTILERSMYPSSSISYINRR